MAKRRHLRKAPITEALISFQVGRLSADLGTDRGQLVQKLAPSYYRKGDIQERPLPVTRPAQAADPAMQAANTGGGVRLHSQDEKYVAQALPTGLTVSRLSPYGGWESLREEMRRVWDVYCTVLRPDAVTGIAVRYINVIVLSVSPHAKLEDVFTQPPMVPEDMSDTLSSFLNRSVIEDPATQASVAVTLASQAATSPSTLPVILDIEALRQTEFSPGETAVWDFLEKLRELKNAAFFGSLTEAQAGKYE